MFFREAGLPYVHVEHPRFRNLSFAYTNFEFAPGDSNDRQGSANVPAAVTLCGARSCAFEQCRLFNFGTFGFEVMAGCSDNDLTGNELAQLAAGGIRVGGGRETSPPWERTRNNRVEFNHIHHIGGVLSDMGGIYTLGVSPGTVIRNNHIHDVDANHYGGWGIYHDEGSTHLLVENNVVHHTKFAPFNIHFAKEVTVRNNIFALGKLEQASRGRAEPHKSVFFENNIVYWREGELLSQNWKDVPYTFHAHPKDESGTQTLTDTFEFDWNLYFNPTKTRVGHVGA